MILVDEEDEDVLRARWWRVRADGYVTARCGHQTFYLHREIMRKHGLLEDGKTVDHKNNDGPKSDCRKSNLRVVTHSLNNHNRGATNVSNCRGRYGAKVTIDYKQYHLGVFDTAQEAHEAAQQFKREKGLT
jgi:hypothetical protein